MSQDDDLPEQLPRTLAATFGGEDTAQLSNRTLTGGEIEGWVPGTHLFSPSSFFNSPATSRVHRDFLRVMMKSDS